MGSSEKVKAPAILKWEGRLVSPSDIDEAGFEKQLKEVVGFERGQIDAVMEVYFWAEKGTAKKIRGTGEPFFEHPKGVALMGMWEFGEKDPLQIQLDLVHDVLDYSTIMSEDAWRRYLGNPLFGKLKGVTKPEKGESDVINEINRKNYYEKIAKDEYMLKCKAKDRTYNFRTIQGVGGLRAQRKLRSTEQYLLPGLKRFHDQRYFEALALEAQNVRAYIIAQGFTPIERETR